MGYVLPGTKPSQPGGRDLHVAGFSPKKWPFSFLAWARWQAQGFLSAFPPGAWNWHSREGEGGQQGISQCFVIVGGDWWGTGLLASVVKSQLGLFYPQRSCRVPYPGTSSSVSLCSSRFSSLPGQKTGSSTVVSSIALNKWSEIHITEAWLSLLVPWTSHS